MQKIRQEKIIRILDANINRVKEALRVCEDTARFVLGSSLLTKKFKTIRHEVSSLTNSWSLKKKDMLQSRDVKSDCGKASVATEMKRETVRDIFLANIQRAKESIRVLEEFTKLINSQDAQRFKEIRYKIYHLEYEVYKKL